MSESKSTPLQHQFADLEQQHEASHVGMWIYLATEIMFFGPLFLAYTLYHTLYPEAFAMASHHSDFWLGSVNTAVLLTSSLFMALAVGAAKEGDAKATVRFLLITMLLGTLFLGFKGLEYYHHFQEHLVPGPSFDLAGSSRGTQMFFYLYFAMTGLHAVHMIIGLAMLAVLVVYARRGKFTADYHTPVEMIGLYWHFVDVIWIFLFPMFYLAGRR